MKSIKVLGLVVAAALAVLAIGASSASAVTLCNANEPKCKTPYKADGTTTIKATLEAKTATTLKAAFTISCTDSEIKGKTTKDEGPGKVLQGEITSVTFTNCTGCTTEQTINVPIFAELLTDPKVQGNGLWNWTGNGKGNPKFKFEQCPNGITCTFGEKAMVFYIAGGNPAKLLVGKMALVREEGNPICGPGATWEGTYVFSEPAPLFVEKE